ASLYTKQVRPWHLDVVTRECAMNPILHSRAQPHQKNAEAEQLTLIAQLARRNPHFRQSAIAQQDRQSSGVQLVGLVGQAHAPLGLERIAQPGVVARALHLIDQPTVATASFHRDCRMCREPLQKLAVKLSIVSYAQRLAGLALFVHRDEHRELLVSVASDKLFHTAAPPRRESTSTPAAALS